MKDYDKRITKFLESSARHINEKTVYGWSCTIAAVDIPNRTITLRFDD